MSDKEIANFEQDSSDEFRPNLPNRNTALIDLNTNSQADDTNFESNHFPAIDIHSKLNNIKPNDKRAKIAQLFVWSVMAIEIISIGSSYLQIVLLEAFQNGE